MKYIKRALCILFFLLFSASPSLGQESIYGKDLHPIKVYIDGLSYNRERESFAFKDRTYLRADLIEKIFSLQSSPFENGRFHLKGKNFDLILPLDKPGGIYNGDLLPLEYFAKIQDGYLYYPLKLICDKKGYNISWSQEMDLVLASKEKEEAKKKETNIIYNGGSFSLAHKSRTKEEFVFRDKNKDLEIYYRDSLDRGEEIYLGKVMRTRSPKVTKDLGRLLGQSKGYFYEFYWSQSKIKDQDPKLAKLIEELTLLP